MEREPLRVPTATEGPCHEARLISLPPEAILSPSLRPRDAGRLPSFELKFLVGEPQAREIERWLNDRFFPDPHGDPLLGGAYRTISVYTDTVAWDVYRRSSGFCRRKFRIRRYGEHSPIFLERKSKSNDRVWKKRCAVGEETLALLVSPLCPSDWPGKWFHSQLKSRSLVPACRVSYLRQAWLSIPSDGPPIRVTIDRQIFGEPSNDWSLRPLRDGRELFPGQVLVELKFRQALPLLLKQILVQFRLTPTSASKYRRCCETWGVLSPSRGAARA